MFIGLDVLAVYPGRSTELEEIPHRHDFSSVSHRAPERTSPQPAVLH